MATNTKASAETEAAVRKVIERLNHLVATRSDVNEILDMYMDQGLQITPVAGDKITDKSALADALRRDQDETKEAKLEINDCSVCEGNGIAWASVSGRGKLVSNDGTRSEFPLLMSAVLMQEGGGWKIAQSHLSVPASIDTAALKALPR